MKGILQKVLVKNLHFLILAFTILNRLEDCSDHLDTIALKDNETSRVMSQIAKFKKRSELVEEFLKDLEESKKRLDDIAKHIEKIQQQLPETIKDRDIFLLFSNEAEIMNIKDFVLEPQQENKRSIYFVKGYKLEAMGTYLQFLVYFERLKKNPRIIDISELEIKTSGDQTNRGRFKLVDVTATVEVFRYDPIRNKVIDDKGEVSVERKGSS